MKKERKFWMSPEKRFLYCQVYINGKHVFTFTRNLHSFDVSAFKYNSFDDVTTFDLELHAFLRISHQIIVRPDVLAGEKIEEMFEIDNPNI